MLDHIALLSISSTASTRPRNSAESVPPHGRTPNLINRFCMRQVCVGGLSQSNGLTRLSQPSSGTP